MNCVNLFEECTSETTCRPRVEEISRLFIFFNANQCKSTKGIKKEKIQRNPKTADIRPPQTTVNLRVELSSSTSDINS